jgi:hypothetical protein
MVKIAKPDTGLAKNVIPGFHGQLSYSCTFTLSIIFVTLSDITGIKQFIYLMYTRQLNGSRAG